MNKPTILLIEDDIDLQDGLKTLLGEQYSVVAASNGLDGIKEAIRNPPELILLDIKMPKINGFETCKAIREDKILKSVPIILLTAYNTTKDRLKAFEAGADDFIAKPFNSKELLLRIKRKISTHYEKPTSQQNGNILNCGDILLNLETESVFLKGQELPLSKIEFRLLGLFALNCGRLLDRKFILEKVWQKRTGSPRLIDPHIVSLRAKLSQSSHAIVSVYKSGYILKSRTDL